MLREEKASRETKKVKKKKERVKKELKAKM